MTVNIAETNLIETPAACHPDRRGLAIVTGGAGGIGRSIARGLLQDGFDVVVGDPDGGARAQVASELDWAGNRFSALPLDVTSEDSVAAFFDRVQSDGGSADVLINGAGAIAVQRLADIRRSDWSRIIDVNLTGTFLCTQRMLNDLGTERWGRVVNIASQSGKMGTANVSHYCSAKFGVIGFTQAVAMEVATTGVTVNAVCPTMVETDMMAQVLDGHRALGGPDRAEQIAQLEALIPQGRLAQPDDVATVVRFLCSREAAYLTGQAINVTGGAWMS